MAERRKWWGREEERGGEITIDVLGVTLCKQRELKGSKANRLGFLKITIFKKILDIVVILLKVNISWENVTFVLFVFFL